MKLPITEKEITAEQMVRALTNLRKNPTAFEAFFIGYGWIEGISYCDKPESKYVRQTAIPNFLEKHPHICLWLCRYFLNRETD